MPDSHTLELIRLFADLLLVPMVSVMWDMQKRLSRIEGMLKGTVRDE